MTIEDERRQRLSRLHQEQMTRLLDPNGIDGQWFALFLLAMLRPTPTETSNGR